VIITIVRFAAPSVATPAEQRALIERTAPRYREIPGLRRKWFVSAPGEGGGVYEWRSREDAERWFTPQWLEQMRSRYGVEPRIDWLEGHAVVDNVAGRIDFDDQRR
jgi:hypothetical protein